MSMSFTNEWYVFNNVIDKGNPANSGLENIFAEDISFNPVAKSNSPVLTGATFTIKTADKTPLLLSTINTRPKPLNAEPDDEFGFSETITDGPAT